ncbi:MAG: hypothetical protein Q4Q04_03510 [Methanocorpusculum sp.]|nr:hypothetical protein [Methanocorpusculum sp.]
MASRQQTQSFKKRKKSPAGLITIICIVIGIIIAGGAAAIYAASNTISGTITQANVQMSCFISGNDLVAQIHTGGASEDVTYLELVMEGYTMPPALCTQPVPQNSHYPKEIIYKDVAAGIKGELQILFKASFRDGIKKTIWTGTVRFT